MTTIAVRSWAIALTGCLAACATTPPAQHPCSAPAGIAAPVDAQHAIFGLALGQPLALPECPKIGAGAHIQYGYSKESCYQRTTNIAACSALIDGYARIEFPVLSLPYWAKSVTARVVEGRIEGIRIYTSGIKGQKPALDALSEKFGKPSSSLNTEVQNRMGAKYQSLNSLWTVSDVSVVLIGTTGHLDDGEVEIATPIGHSAYAADAAKLEEGIKKL